MAYDGTEYSGWQVQENHSTIQGRLQEVLSELAREPVTVNGAGRTDAGVHALGQNASFRLPNAWDPNTLRAALNGNLPPDIRVLNVAIAADDFHARFSASRKTYRYQIWNGPVMNPLLERFAWHRRTLLDADHLHQTAQTLVGRHDFTAFTTSDCDTPITVRTINEIRIERSGDLINLHFTGEGFLRYQVRKMTAALAADGRSLLKLPLPEILRLGKRDLIPGMAPAKGLTLLDVQY